MALMLNSPLASSAVLSSSINIGNTAFVDLTLSLTTIRAGLSFDPPPDSFIS